MQILEFKLFVAHSNSLWVDIKDGHTMHLVRSARPAQPAAPSTASPGTSTTGKSFAKRF